MVPSTRPSCAQAALGLAATAAAVIALAPASAEAQYLDPGAGSIIVQAVVALVVGLGVTAKLYWHRIAGRLSRRPKDRRQP
jgi:hypothetical protein